MSHSAETLIAALDKAAIALLEKSEGSDIVENADNPAASADSSLAEQAKAFQAVVEYVKIRPTLVPQKKKESALDGLKRQFNGETTDGRGKRRKVEAEPPANGAADSPGAAAPISLDA